MANEFPEIPVTIKINKERLKEDFISVKNYLKSSVSDITAFNGKDNVKDILSRNILNQKFSSNQRVPKITDISKQFLKQSFTNMSYDSNNELDKVIKDIINEDLVKKLNQKFENNNTDKTINIPNRNMKQFLKYNIANNPNIELSNKDKTNIDFKKPFKQNILSVAQTKKINNETTEKLIEEEKKIANKEEDDNKERDKKTDKYQKTVIGSLGKITKWGMIAAPFAISRMIKSATEGNFKNALMFGFTGADRDRTFLTHSAFRRHGLDPAATNELMGSLYGQYLSATYEGKFPRAVGWLLGKNPYHRDPTKTLDEIFKGYQKLDFDKQNMLLMDLFGGNAYKIRQAFDERIEKGLDYWSEDIKALAALSPTEREQKNLEDLRKSMESLKDLLSKGFTQAVIDMAEPITNISNWITKKFLNNKDENIENKSILDKFSLPLPQSMSNEDKDIIFGLERKDAFRPIGEFFKELSDYLDPFSSLKNGFQGSSNDININLSVNGNKVASIPVTQINQAMNFEVGADYV